MSKKSTSPTSRKLRNNNPHGLQYQSLEQRLPLDASFSFVGGELTLFDFDENSTLFVETDGDIVAELPGQEWMGDRTIPGITVNDETNDAGDVTGLGDELTVAGVTSLVISSNGRNSPVNSVTFSVEGAETLDNLDINVRGNIQFNSFGNAFNTLTTRFITDGNLTQTDNSNFVATNIDFGSLAFDVGGNVSFDSLSGTVVDPILGVAIAGGPIGGRATGGLTIVSDIGDLNFADQFGIDFDNESDVEPDGLFVGGTASITIGSGSISQSASVIVNGDFNISNRSDGANSIDLSSFGNNNFSTIDLTNRSLSSPADFRIADRNAVTIEDVRAQNVYFGAGQVTLGQLDIIGDITSTTLGIQASNGFEQAASSAIRTERLVAGGSTIGVSRGDYLFRGSVEGRFLSPGDLLEIDVAFRVRGNLDLFTNSELNVIDTDLIFTDGRDTEQFDSSYADGDTRIAANSIDFSVEFETTKFVLALESDGTQTSESSILADQFYVSGTRIDFGSELNDVNQIAGRATGDESFLRFFDVGTVRIISLDGEIDGDSVDRAALPVIAGVSTERLPQIDIGENSFIDIRTGLGGPVLNPRLGAPDVALDDIERFTVERDANILTFETEDFGVDGRGTFFIEFIHDGVSPFEIVAQGFGFDAELALYDEVGNVVFRADDPVLNLNANITGEDFETPLAAGRYFIASAAFSATFADNFNVQTQFTPENQPTGRLLISLEIGQPSEVITDEVVTIQSTLDTSFSQDLRNFGFVLNEASDVSIFTGTNNRPGEESAFDTQIYVFAVEADGTLTLDPSLVFTDDDTGGGRDSFLNLSLAAGRYVTVVGEFSLEEAEARAGVADAGEGGPFEITFAGVDGAIELPAGQVDPGLTDALLSGQLIEPITRTFLVPTDLTPAGAVNTFDPALLSDVNSLVTGDSITIAGSLDVGEQRLSNFGFVKDQAGVVTIFTGDQVTTAQDSDFDTEFFIFELEEDGDLGALVATAGVTPDGFDSQITLDLAAGSYVAVLGEFPLLDSDARTGNTDIVIGGDFQITFQGTDGVVAVLPVTFQDRLNSFIAPEVRRSIFQDEDAPIDTELLILSAAEDGSILIEDDLNQIDVISILETDDFMLGSSTSIVINQLNANGNVVLEAIGDVTANNVEAAGNFTITSGANISTSDISADGVIDFAAVGDVTVNDLTVDNVTVIDFDEFGNAIVNSIDSGGSISVSNADVDGALDLTSVRNVSVTDLTVDSVIVGDAAVLGNVTINSGASIIASDVDADGTVDFTSVRIARVSNLNANGSAFINSGANISVSVVDVAGPISLSAAGSVALQLVTTNSTLNADSGNDVIVDGITATSNVSLEAADDIRFSFSNGIRRLVADNLTLVANNANDDFNGILLFTDVNSVSGFVQRSGQIFLNELSGVTIGNLSTDDGSISLRANGTITGTSVAVTRPGSSITLVARGDDADINVGSISSTGSSDSIRLLADDDVFAQVQGGELRVQAKNTVSDGNLSVNLSTTVRSLSVDAGLNSNAVLNRGDINIRETDGLELTRAVAANGRILVSAQGNLISTNVQAAGVAGDDVIRLSATGDGADLITSRVVVRNRIGGVVLRANDDIFESNINDQLQVVGSRATYIAGNSQQDNFNGIIGQSSAATVSTRVTSTAEAGVFMFGSGNTVITESSVANGRFSFINRTGVITVEDLVVRSSTDIGRVFLKTEGLGGDILLGRVDSGSQGFVTVDSADDVLDTDTRDEFFVRGEFLGVTSRNNKAETFDGILLNIDVDDFADAALNGGQSFIRRRS